MHGGVLFLELDADCNGFGIFSCENSSRCTFMIYILLWTYIYVSIKYIPQGGLAGVVQSV